MADEPRAELPTEEELKSLSRWARVAFAARCAQRVRPLFKHSWPDAPAKHVEAVDTACTLAAASAVDPATATNMSRAYAADAADAAADAHGGDAAAYAAAYAADAAHDAADAAAYTAAAAAYTAAAAARAATDDAYAATARRDFELLLALQSAASEAGTPWGDETGVDPDLLGPLWAFGEPEGWPEEAKEERVGDTEVTLEFEFPDEVPSEDAINFIVEAMKRADALAKASGGSGLVRKGVEVLSDVREGVPS